MENGGRQLPGRVPDDGIDHHRPVRGMEFLTVAFECQERCRRELIHQREGIGVAQNGILRAVDNLWVYYPHYARSSP